MKINRHGRAKVLTQQEIQLIFSHGLDNDRDRTLFGVCLFSACRIREACTLLTEDIYTPKGLVRPQLIIRKANTKGKLAMRSIPVIEDLRQLLNNYYPKAGKPYLFPGRSNGHISEDSAARILRGACKQVGIFGVSTHSFRRTALTQMSNAGIPLRVIQEISGHRNLEQLQKYLEVSDQQVLGAAVSLAMLSPVGVDVVIDLEVDEPISFATGKPTHCIGEDDYRNKCFVDANWLVIRFAEEQVSSQPERCARFIAGAIAQLTDNNTYRQKLLHVEKVTPMRQWSARQASKLKKSDYRQGYLVQRKN